MAAVELPLIVIVGPTASGKSALAMDLAEQFGGEIICADSRTVYKGMDIGTAKPTAQDRARVPHWGLDLVEPNQSFSAADFKEYANKKIAEVRKKGHVPFLVGGTGLYIDGVILDYQFGPADPALRAKLEDMAGDELRAYCIQNNIVLPENSKNKRYIIRAIEQKSINTKRLHEPQQNIIVVGVTTDKDTLVARIKERSEQLFAHGVIEEATQLAAKYGWQSEAMTANIYRLIHQFLDGQLTETELKAKFVTADWQLAKRQLTWLRRHDFIKWFSLPEAHKYLASRLAELVQP